MGTAVAAQESKPARSAHAWQAWIPLALAALLLLLSNGRNTVPLAAWLAPVFLLRFTRGGGGWKRLPVAACVIYATWLFQFRGMVPAPPLFVFMIAAGFSAAVLLPYVVDRVLSNRLRAGWSTLAFPVTWAATEYITSVLSPYSSWGSAAYSQYGVLPLVQMVSVTGLYGITFLIGWFATTVNLLWEHDWHPVEVRKPVIAFAAVLGVALLGGGVRLAFFDPDSQAVRVVSLSRGNFPTAPTEELERRFFSKGAVTNDETEQIRQTAMKGVNDLFSRSERAADAGAKIVFWSEATAQVLKQDEPAVIARGQEIARNKQIYLGLGLGVWTPRDPVPMENKLVLLSPNGQVLFDYIKVRPVPGWEKQISKVGDGLIKSTITPYGRIGAAICFDMDFPQVLADAGDMNTDILLVPSNDWEDIDPWHTQMATFRAVEQGFNLVRQVRSGMSMAVDYEGRVLAQMDDFTSPDREMTAYVPTRGVRTVYARIGDAFAWMCIIGLILLPIAARKRG